MLARALTSDQTPTYCLRELGEKHKEYWGGNLAGILIDDVFPSNRVAIMRGIYDSSLIEGLPSFQHSLATAPGVAEVESERVLLPVVDANGEEVLLGIIYVGGELDQEEPDDEGHTVQMRANRAAADAATENFQIRLDVDGVPVSVENIIAADAAADETEFRQALAPMVRKVRSGLSVNMGRRADGMLRIIESRLDVQVAASLSLLPTENDDDFLASVAPYLEAFRAGVLRAAEVVEASPGEVRKWRVRPRYQSFIGFRLQRAALQLGRDMADTLQEELDISLPELRVIATLGQDGMQTISDAAEKTLMDRAQVSRTLRNLSKKGLLEKFTDRHDRRISWLSLTEAGEDRWEEIYPILRRRNDKFSAQLSTEDLRIFLRVLDLLGEVVDGEPDAPPKMINLD